MKTLLPLALCLVATVNHARTYSAKALAGVNHKPVRCETRLTRTDGKPAVQLSPVGNSDQQLLLLDGANLRNGVIEFEVFASARDRFVGLAWHVASETEYEAVYFRPFRFRDPDPVGNRHAVQYVSHPNHTWRKLRTEFPDVYEGRCPVDPEQWIRVRIEIQPDSARVFVAGLDQPALNVERPFRAGGTGVALWTGVATKGSFANVSVAPADTASAPRPTPGPPASKAVPIARATGDALDLLDRVAPDRHALVGDWSKRAGELEVQPKPFAHIALPDDLPQSYDIDLAFTRKGPNEQSVAVFLPVGGKGVAVQFAAQGKHDGIGLINGVASWLGPATRPTTLKNGKRVEASIRVRQQGDKVRITQYVDGEPRVSWAGPTRALSLYQAFKIPSGKAGLGAFDNNTVFHSVILRSAD